MRVKYLDGLRGIAILLVIFFHAYNGENIRILPHDSDFPIIKFGWLGVELFFLLSGFVIFMTLDKTSNFKSYLYKRWLRLFPAMLIASVLIYSTFGLFPDRPHGIPPNLLSILPGLTFTLPSWWSSLLGVDVQILEGSFWSLYVEFKFYIIAGITYYLFGRKFLAPILVGLFVFSALIQSLSSTFDFQVFHLMQKVSSALDLKHFGWFAAGSLFYTYHQTKQNKWFYYALILAVFSSITIRRASPDFSLDIFIGALMITLLFASSLKSVVVQRLLETKVLLFFGLISYPLYLIHDNALISMITQLAVHADSLPAYSYPFAPLILLTLTAYFIAKYLEPRLSAFLYFVFAQRSAYSFNLLKTNRSIILRTIEHLKLGPATPARPNGAGSIDKNLAPKSHNSP